MRNRISRRVYPPMVAANPTDKWYAEVRHNGFIMRDKRFDTKEQAEKWAKYAKPTMTRSVGDYYIKVMKEKAIA